MSEPNQNGRQKTKCPPNTKLSITHSFLELQSAAFLWKFVWTVRTNSENKMAAKNKMVAIRCQLGISTKAQKGTKSTKEQKRAKKLHLSANY